MHPPVKLQWCNHVVTPLVTPASRAGSIRVKARDGRMSRVPIAAGTIQAVLGRPLQRVTRTAATVSTNTVDDFTMTWWQENGAQQCLHCGAWMVREDDDRVMCLCGGRYCWTCHAAADGCDCGHTEYYDTVTHLHAGVYIHTYIHTWHAL